MLHLHVQDNVTKESGDIKVEKTSNIVRDSFMNDILRIDPERDNIIIVLNFVPRYNDVNATLEFIETYDNLKNNKSKKYCYSLDDLMRLWWAASQLQIILEVEEKLAKIIYDEIFTDKYTKNQVLSILYDDYHPKDPHLDLYLAEFYGLTEMTERLRLPVDNKVFYRNLISDKIVSYDRSTGEIKLYDKNGKIIEIIDIDDIPINITFHSGNRDIGLTFDDHILLYGSYPYEDEYKIWIIDVTQCIEDFGSMKNNNNEYIKWLNKFDSDHSKERGHYRDNKSTLIDHRNGYVQLSVDGTKYNVYGNHNYIITDRYRFYSFESVHVKYQEVENDGHVIFMSDSGFRETIPIVYFPNKFRPHLDEYKHLPTFSGYNSNMIRVSPDQKLIMFEADGKIIIMNIVTRKIILQLNTKLIDNDIDINNIMLFNSGLIAGAGIVKRKDKNRAFNFGNKYYIINLDGEHELIGYGPQWRYKPDHKYSLFYNNGHVVKFGGKKVWFKKLLDDDY